MIHLPNSPFKDTRALLAEGLRCADAGEPGAIGFSDLLRSREMLKMLLAQCAAQCGTTDLRPVASAWLLRHIDCFLPSAAAASTLFHHIFPLDDPGVALIVDHGHVKSVLIPHTGAPAFGSDTATRYASLLDGHLAPLIDCLSEIAKLPTKILWGNVARRLDALFEQTKSLALPDEAISSIATDRDYLLQQPVWENGQRNPLFGQRKSAVHERTGKPETVRLHRQCCLNYLLPNANHCGLCPLAPDIRLIEQES